MSGEHEFLLETAEWMAARISYIAPALLLIGWLALMISKRAFFGPKSALASILTPDGEVSPFVYLMLAGYFVFFLPALLTWLYLALEGQIPWAEVLGQLK